MADDYGVDSGGAYTRSLSAKKTAGDVSDAQAAARMGTTAGAGLGAKAKSASGMPKQEDGESASDYGARLRTWRESGAGAQAQGQKKALLAMGSGS